MGINLSDDDYLLLLYACEQEYIKLDTIKTYIWNDRNQKSVNRRLNKLIKNNFLKRVDDPDPDTHYKKYLITPTKYSLDLLKIKDEEGRLNKIRKKYNLANIPINYFKEQDDYISFRDYHHNQELNKIRFEIEKSANIKWLPERLLKKEMFGWENEDIKNGLEISRHLVDGLLIKNDGTQVAIEHERSRKNNSRYSKIFASLQLDKEIEEILYILKGNSVYNHFINCFNKTYPLDKSNIDVKIEVKNFYFITYNNLINEQGPVFQLSEHIPINDNDKIERDIRINNIGNLKDFLKGRGE